MQLACKNTGRLSKQNGSQACQATRRPSEHANGNSEYTRQQRSPESVKCNQDKEHEQETGRQTRR